MPLAKLFQRRNSSQKDRKKSLTTPDVSASASEANQHDQIVATSSERGFSETNPQSDFSLEETEKNKSLDTQPESDDPNDDSNVHYETSRRCSVPETSGLMEQARHKSRSLSLKESGTKIHLPKTRRRKCESESAAFSSTDDEGFEDKIIQLRERDLEKVVGQVVGRVIRESILEAVKSVKVDNIYEDVIKSLSRSSSESSDSTGGPETVQQKLHSESVTEYADLQRVHTFEEEEEIDEIGESKLEKDSEESADDTSDRFQPDIQSENVKKDSPERESLKSTESGNCSADVESVDEAVDTKESFEISESDNPKTALEPEIQAETEANDSAKSNEHCELSTDEQNEDAITEVESSHSERLDTLIISDNVNNEAQKIAESEAGEQTNEVTVCQENDVPAESSHKVTEQIEIVEDTVDSAIQKRCHMPQTEDIEEVTELKDELIDETDDCKIEIEEVKDITADGYHADIEESISLHSMASESSFENIIDSKTYSRTISDDTVTSIDEVNLGGQSDATLRKDADEVSQEQPGNEKVCKTLSVETDLMAMSGDDFSHLLTATESTTEPSTPASDLGENLPEQKPVEEEKKVNWKVGYLHVKLPHKSRHKGLKVWKKRCVAIQPDEFAGDDSDPCLVLSVYSGDSSAAKKHSASFWKSVSCQKAVIYRSSSRTHPYSLTISDDKRAVIHLAADSEAISQEWMAAIRAILWPPSPVVQLEKMLNGREFEISIIDNEFSYHAGLLGMYGYLTITPKKLILVHPQQGYVIQEWYLNTIDKFQLIPQTRIEDVNKVLSMTTCSDSSTGKGDILIFCKEAVALLQTVASTIHQILSHHSKQEGGKYQKELAEIGEWLVADSNDTEDYYKVPPRQVKSLLDIPNFIFNKPLAPVATAESTSRVATESQKSTLEVPKANLSKISQESNISSETVSDDFLNCSSTSFVVGGGPFPGKSSDSELSDTYTPPRSPEVRAKREPTESSEAAAKS